MSSDHTLDSYRLPDIDPQWLTDFDASLSQHISFVIEAGLALGLPETELTGHDASKYTVIEFPFYARQFYGDGGDPQGFARAWLHHQNDNPHHWEYWITRSAPGPIANCYEDGCLAMPLFFYLEMVADWLGASRAYTAQWDIHDWYDKNRNRIRLHPETRQAVEALLIEIDYGKEFS